MIILLAQLVNYLILQSHPIPQGITGSAVLSTFKKLFFNRPVRARSVLDFCLLSLAT